MSFQLSAPSSERLFPQRGARYTTSVPTRRRALSFRDQLASAATRLLASLLFGLTWRDPATFMLAVGVLLAVAAAAAALPARRAARTDPSVARRIDAGSYRAASVSFSNFTIAACVP
jgi:hypothetical protein